MIGITDIIDIIIFIIRHFVLAVKRLTYAADLDPATIDNMTPFTIGNISFLYNSSLIVKVKNKKTFFHYELDTFYLIKSVETKPLDKGYIMTDKDWESFFTRVTKSFSKWNWSNVKLASEIKSIEINGLNLKTATIKMTRRKKSHNSIVAAFFHDGYLTFFLLFSDTDFLESKKVVEDFENTLSTINGVQWSIE